MANVADKYIDLHLHLDGAMNVEIARKLGELQGIELPEDDKELESLIVVPEDCESLNDFLKCFELASTLTQTPEGVREAVRLVGDTVASQGVIYAEIRFAPQLHTKRGMTQEDVVRAALEGLKETVLKANLILCCIRGEGNDTENEETVELAKKYLVEDGGVVAIDLAGAEALYPTSKYGSLFEKAREYGIPFTIHAGEADGAESVRLAVKYGASRIGHAVRAQEDETLLPLMKERGITIEMCPTSNRQTRAVKDMSDYPLMDYLKMGLNVTINTDDQGVEKTDLANEYRYVQELFDLSEDDRNKILANAVNGAFTTEEVKEQLREQLGLK